jgi:hypothetical protein
MMESNPSSANGINSAIEGIYQLLAFVGAVPKLSTFETNCIAVDGAFREPAEISGFKTKAPPELLVLVVVELDVCAVAL